MIAHNAYIKPETIEQIASLLDGLSGVPEVFSEDFRLWATRWNQGGAFTIDNKFKKWGIEIRPYHISELAKQPGMPGRTSLHRIVKCLDLEKSEMRNSCGRLTPDTVLKVVENVACSARKYQIITTRGRD